VIRRLLKTALNVVALALTAPLALTCRIQEMLLPKSLGMFTFWAHVVAQVPGDPGLFIRRGFYRWMLAACAERVHIEFGAILNRRAVLESGAYIGTYALIGWAVIREKTLVGSRASIPSGGHQHTMLPSGTWSPTDPSRLTCVTIGPNTWIGEAAVVMADVGRGCMIAAGSVVASPVPDGVMMAGNPARFVRNVVAEPEQNADDATVPAVH
jgi:virginiamycin A acetyltransferase